MLTLVPSADQQQAAEQIREAHNWGDISVDQILEMPSFVIGSREQMVEQLCLRRERYEFSYFIVADDQMQQCAPLVRALAGQ